MKIEQRKWTHGQGRFPDGPSSLKESAQLVLVFGATSLLKDDGHFHRIRKTYPGADVIGCSTAGEVCGLRVFDDSLVTTAVHFDAAKVSVAATKITNKRKQLRRRERAGPVRRTRGTRSRVCRLGRPQRERKRTRKRPVVMFAGRSDDFGGIGRRR